MIRRILLFLLVAPIGYVLTVAAAFLFWEWTGTSGPDYTPLLVVLFGVAPLVAVLAGSVAAGLRLRRTTPPARPTLDPNLLPRRRNGPLQIAIAVGIALAVGAFMLATGHVPHFPHYIPR